MTAYAAGPLKDLTMSLALKFVHGRGAELQLLL